MSHHPILIVGGGTAGIEVAYQGEPIGNKQYLLIGVDPFVAREGVLARGGCCMHPTANTASAWWLLGLGLWIRRRKRIQKLPPRLSPV